MKFLQNKPQVKGTNIKYYDLYYTVKRLKMKKRFKSDENDFYDKFVMTNYDERIKFVELNLMK